MDVAFGVIGTVGVALHSAHRVYELVTGIRGAPYAVESISKDIQALSSALETLRNILGTLDDPRQLKMIPMLQIPLDNCVATLHDIEIKLKPHIKLSDGKPKIWRGFVWTFREKDITTLQTTLMIHKQSLDIAISIADYSNNVSTGVNSRENFGAVREGIRRLDRRLDADQESVVDQTFAGSQTAGSDYGYAMKQWLLRAETVFDDIISNSTGVTDSGPGQPESPETGTTLKRGFYRVMYDYTPGSADAETDLAVKASDIVALLGEDTGIRAGWPKCQTAKGSSGFLPGNYLEAIQGSSGFSPAIIRQVLTVSGQAIMADADMEPDNLLASNTLIAKIMLRTSISHEKATEELKHHAGFFKSSAALEWCLSGGTTLPSARRVRAIFTCYASEDSDLPIRKHDVIDIVSSRDPYWLTGSLKGRIGYFPSNYVEPI